MAARSTWTRITRPLRPATGTITTTRTPARSPTASTASQARTHRRISLTRASTHTASCWRPWPGRPAPSSDGAVATRDRGRPRRRTLARALGARRRAALSLRPEDVASLRGRCPRLASRSLVGRPRPSRVSHPKRPPAAAGAELAGAAAAARADPEGLTRPPPVAPPRLAEASPPSERPHHDRTSGPLGPLGHPRMHHRVSGGRARLGRASARRRTAGARRGPAGARRGSACAQPG
jgi:hypothetical protein